MPPQHSPRPRGENEARVLRTRIWTAAVALPNAGFSWFIAIVGGWGLYEIATITAIRGIVSLLVIFVAGAVPLLAILVAGDGGFWVAPAAVFLIMLALIAIVARRGGEAAPKGLPLEIAGSLWVGVLFPYLAMLRNLPGGIAGIILMLLVVIASDTGAYFGGRIFGVHKLAPRVSPNKTVEGALAGLIASIAAGMLLRAWLVSQWKAFDAAAISAAIAVLAQIGDAAGSAFKRAAGVKDSGWIFPGHGGLLDRTCSLVFAAVFTYYCLK